MKSDLQVLCWSKPPYKPVLKVCPLVIKLCRSTVPLPPPFLVFQGVVIHRPESAIKRRLPSHAELYLDCFATAPFFRQLIIVVPFYATSYLRSAIMEHKSTWYRDYLLNKLHSIEVTESTCNRTHRHFLHRGLAIRHATQYSPPSVFIRLLVVIAFGNTNISKLDGFGGEGKGTVHVLKA